MMARSLVRKINGAIRWAFTAYGARAAGGGSRGGSERWLSRFSASATSNSRLNFRTLRRAGYRIRTGDLQLGKLTLYR